MKKIAIVGANGNIGRELLEMLAESGYNKADVVTLDIAVPMGTQVAFGEEDDIDVANLEGFDFSKVDLAVFAAEEELSKQYVRKAVDKGAKVIDCSSVFFADADVPMILSGVNDKLLKQNELKLITVPSAVVAQILVPLCQIDKDYDIKRLIVSTYNSTSIYGQEGMDELFAQTRKIFMNESLYEHQKVFEKQVAFNVIPQVEDFIGDETKYEWRINAEIKKIVGHEIKVHANCAIVPAFVGSAAYVNVECEKDVDVADVEKLMKKVGGLVLFDKKTKGGYVTLNDVQGEHEVYISRLRQDVSVQNGFSFWTVADDLRFGIVGNIYKIIKLWA